MGFTPEQREKIVAVVEIEEAATAQAFQTAKKRLSNLTFAFFLICMTLAVVVGGWIAARLIALH